MSVLAARLSVSVLAARLSVCLSVSASVCLSVSVGAHLLTVVWPVLSLPQTTRALCTMGFDLRFPNFICLQIGNGQIAERRACAASGSGHFKGRLECRTGQLLCATRDASRCVFIG